MFRIWIICYKKSKKYTKKINQYILKSFMNEIKRDIDATVLECARYMEFSAVMHNKGYSFGEINDESVIYHPYCEEPIYIKSLGNQYHREQIKERLTTKVIPFQNMEQNKYYYQCKDYYRQYRKEASTTCWNVCSTFSLFEYTSSGKAKII